MAATGTVAVAGGTGFVGSEIVRELRRRGRHVVVLSSRGETARGQLPDDVEIRHADIRHADSLVPALDGVDELVIALAFPGSPVEQPGKGHTFMDVDAHGTERLIAAGRERGGAQGRLHLWRGRQPRGTTALVPRQGHRRGRRARLGHELDHPAADAGSTAPVTSR